MRPLAVLEGGLPCLLLKERDYCLTSDEHGNVIADMPVIVAVDTGVPGGKFTYLRQVTGHFPTGERLSDHRWADALIISSPFSGH